MVKRTVNRKRPIRRRNNKRRVNRRRRGARTRPSIKPYQTGLPRQMFGKLKYYENNYQYTLGATDKIVYTQMRLNDPHDPYAALGGKSALYYDFWMQAFRYCRVMAAKITITWQKTSDVNQGVIFALCPNLFGSLWSDMDDVSSQPYVKTSRRFANRLGSSQSLSYYIPMHKLLNMTQLQYISQLPGSVYDATYNASPTKGCLMDIVAGRLNENDTTVITGSLMVSIKFYCKFYQRYQFVETGTDAGEEELDDGEVAKPTTLPDFVLTGTTGAAPG